MIIYGDNLQEKGSYQWTGSQVMEGKIPNGVTITLTNGDLIINGDIGSEVHIIVKNEKVKKTRTPHTVILNGSIGDFSKIDCKKDVKLIVNSTSIGIGSELLSQNKLEGRAFKTASVSQRGLFSSQKGRYHTFEPENKTPNCFCTIS